MSPADFDRIKGTQMVNDDNKILFHNKKKRLHNGESSLAKEFLSNNCKLSAHVRNKRSRIQGNKTNNIHKTTYFYNRLKQSLAPVYFHQVNRDTINRNVHEINVDSSVYCFYPIISLLLYDLTNPVYKDLTNQENDQH